MLCLAQGFVFKVRCGEARERREQSMVFKSLQERLKEARWFYSGDEKAK